jgi:hypothetical protein
LPKSNVSRTCSLEPGKPLILSILVTTSNFLSPLVIKLLPRGNFRAGLKVINSFVNPFIERVLRLDQNELDEKTKSTEGYTFLHALASYTRDRKVIRDQLVAVLLAGRDTTAGTLSFTILELSSHPHVVAKLRREILERLGSHRAPTYEDLKSMPYLQHTINEILRLYPAVPFNVRMSLHDTTLPHGGGKDGLSPVGIRKDTPIGYSTLHMQRNPEIYQPIPLGFPDVKEFVPERWDGGWNPKPWTYVPFNGGPRICVGRECPAFSPHFILIFLYHLSTPSRFFHIFPPDLHTIISPTLHATSLTFLCHPSTLSLNHITLTNTPKTEQFANIEMGYTLVRILQKFERIEKYWTEAEQTMKSEIVLSPGKEGVRVGFFAPI